MVSVIIIIMKIINLSKINLSKTNLYPKSFWNLIYYFIFDYLSMLMSKQPSFLLTKLSNRSFLMYFIPILSILFSNVIIGEFYTRMISPQHKWCDTIDCFAKSNIKFYTLERPEIKEFFRNNKQNYQINAIGSKIKLTKGNGKLIMYIQINALIRNHGCQVTDGPDP